MTKRPILLMVVALIIGECAAFAGTGKGVVLFIITFFCVVKAVCFSLFSMKKYTILFIAVILSFGAGYYLCNRQLETFDRYDCLQEEAGNEGEKLNVTGTVDSVETTTYGYQMILNTVEGDVLVYTDDVSNLKYGMEVTVSGSFQSMSVATNPGNFDEREYLYSKGIFLKVKAVGITYDNKGEYSFIRERIRKSRDYIKEIILDIATTREQGIIMAMVIGDDGYIEQEQKELYSINGIAHILAISGLHISVIGMGLYKLLRYRFRYLFSALVSSVVMGGFLLLAGNPVSAKRAVIMFVVHMIADILGRKYDMINSLSMAAFLMLIENPSCMMNASFQLSFTAMLAVCFVAPAVTAFYETKNPLGQSIIFNVTMSVVLMPVTSRIFYRQSVYSPLINFFVIPLMGLTLAMSLTGIVAGEFMAAAGRFFVGTAVYIIRFYDWLCEVFSKLPGYSVVTGNISIPDMVFCYIFIALLVLILRIERLKKVIKKASTVVVVALVLLLIFRNKNNDFVMCFLDVGQGDGTYIHSASGNDYLIDCGSTDVNNVGEYRLESFLEYMDVDEVEYAFVSHYDTDHMSGIQELMERGLIKVETLVLPVTAKGAGNGLDNSSENSLDYSVGYSLDYCLDNSPNCGSDYGLDYDLDYDLGYGLDYDLDYGSDYILGYSSGYGLNYVSNSNSDNENYIKLMETAKKVGTKVIYLASGDSLKDGELVFKCISPEEGKVYDDINDSSIVLFMSYKKLATFFTGDISSQVEKELVGVVSEYRKSCETCILKVAHHGSRYSTSEEFLVAAVPDMAVISCGEDNDTTTRLIQFNG